MNKIIKSPLSLTWQIRLFGLRYIPLIFFCRPVVIGISTTSIEVKIPLRHRTKNHLKSMYFGVLSVGADVTGGFLAMKYIKSSKSRISLIFKDFHADFLKRAEGHVHFKCDDGIAIQKLVKNAEKLNTRQNLPISIIARVPAISEEPVAKFVLTLSIKKISH